MSRVFPHSTMQAAGAGGEMGVVGEGGQGASGSSCSSVPVQEKQPSGREVGMSRGLGTSLGLATAGSIISDNRD